MKVSNEIEKNDDVRFTYEQLIKLKHELNDYMSSIECRYLVESMIGTVEKPLIPPGRSLSESIENNSQFDYDIC